MSFASGRQIDSFEAADYKSLSSTLSKNINELLIYKKFIADQYIKAAKNYDQIAATHSQLNQILSEISAKAALSVDDEGLETTYAKELANTINSLNTCLNEYIQIAYNNFSNINELIKYRHDSNAKIKKLVTILVSNDNDINTSKISLKEKLSKYEMEEKDLLKSRLKLKVIIDALKKERCIWFGCIDVYDQYAQS